MHAGPSVVADKRIELQQLAAKVSADPRYLEGRAWSNRRVVPFVAASMLFQPAAKPDRERLKEGLYWLGKLRELNPSLQNNSQLKETEDFFSAFVEGRVPTWDADEATKHAVSLALLGSKDVDVGNLIRSLWAVSRKMRHADHVHPKSNNGIRLRNPFRLNCPTWRAVTL